MAAVRRCGKPRIPEGLGTALKPAWEPIILARKPLQGTIAANVLAHGCGALNIDACRVAMGGERPPSGSGDRRGGKIYAQDAYTRERMANGGNTTPDAGRWPANVMHDGSPRSRKRSRPSARAGAVRIPATTARSSPSPRATTSRTRRTDTLIPAPRPGSISAARPASAIGPAVAIRRSSRSACSGIWRG